MKSIKKYWAKLPHPIRWVIAASIGFTVLFLGLIMLVLPGPGIPLILVGLAILATEFAWAEILLNHTKKRFNNVRHKIRRKR